MKDSGIEWIGEIPEEWTIAELKMFCIVNNGKEIINEVDKCNIDAIPVYGSGGIFKYTDNFMHDGTVVMFGRKGTLGKPIHVTGRFWVVDTMYYLTYMESLNPKYNYYQLLVFNWEPHITQTALPSVVASQIISQKFAFPPTDEQKNIVAYLDKKCAEIDSIIEKTRESIEEYKKLKQAVITEAVTKGVRGKREMKDSGVEWIGEMPKEWTLSRVGLHHNIILGKMLCSEQPNNDYSLESYLCAVNVHFDGVSTTDLKEMWFSEIEKSQYHVENGDLLVVEGGAGAGGCAIVHNLQKPTFIQNSIMIVRNKRNSNIRYLRYLVECLVKRGYIDVVCNKATIPHFTKDKLSTMPFLVLPKEEQQEIADYLDKKTAEIDTLIAKKEALLEELETYKKSLIYEYVTGKKRL